MSVKITLLIKCFLFNIPIFLNKGATIRLYLEKIRNGLLKKTLEYIEGCGLVES